MEDGHKWGKWSLRLAWLGETAWGWSSVAWLGVGTLALGKLAIVLTWPVEFFG